jgi:hypothetical protein
MRPWQHAKSSARKDRDWRADLAIHEFIDSTKMACPDLRHRLILHNADLGPELVARAFPDRADARTVALQHVAEDLGCTPTLADWLDHCDLVRFPRPLSRRLPLCLDELPTHVAVAQGLRDEDGPRAVIELLMLPVSLAGPGALSVLCNGIGPALARSILGPPRLVPGRHIAHAVFDSAYAAETVIQWIFGTIPPLAKVVSAVSSEPSIRQERCSG